MKCGSQGKKMEDVFILDTLAMVKIPEKLGEMRV